VNVWPPMIAVPDRAASVVPTLNDNVPGPLPPAVESVNQLTLLDAVHWHSAAVATVMDPLPPVAAAEYVDGVIVKVQPADWLTVKR
jgi:hypothetical protein